MKKEILTLNVPNKNGRIYSKAVIEESLSKISPLMEKKRFLVIHQNDTIPVDSGVDLTKTVGIVNEIEIVDNKVIADIELLNVPAASQMKDIFENLHARISGVGKLHKNSDGNFVVSEYEQHILF
jgi:hypothetical protein